MNFFVPFLMLTVPGIIAVSIHEGRLIHITRDNWQPLLWKYLIYSFAIVFVFYLIMGLYSPSKTISYSPWTAETSRNIFHPGFVYRYFLFTTAAAVGLPRLWARRRNIIEIAKERYPDIVEFIKARCRSIIEFIKKCYPKIIKIAKERYRGIIELIKRRKSFKIADDE